MTLVFRLLIAVALCIQFGWLTCRTIADELTDSDRAVIAWYDELGYHPARTKDLVRVTWSFDTNNAASQSTRVGMLLQDSEKSFTVFFPELARTTFSKKPAETPWRAKVAFEVISLEDFADAELKRWREWSQLDFDARWRLRAGDPSRYLGQQASDPTQVFVLARFCAEKGLDGRAHRLIAAAAEMYMQDGAFVTRAPSLQAGLSRDIAYTLMWRNVVAMGEPTVSREELAKRFRRFVEQFPNSEYHARARSMLECLEVMIEEDRQHAAITKPFDEMTPDEQIAELIFQLRDQNGAQLSQPGFCDIFADPREQCPASRLVRIGYEAVPQLIEEIESDRFSRSVGYHRNFYFSHHVLSVGHCVREVLLRITGRRFDVDDEPGWTKKLALRWWDKQKEKGEKQLLVEATERADGNSPNQAQRLVEKYPDSAIAAIATGIDRSRDEWIWNGLFQVAASLDNDESRSLLLRHVTERNRLTKRLSAARLLIQQDPAAVSSALVTEWGRRIEDLDTDDKLSGAFGVSLLADWLARNPSTLILNKLESTIARCDAGLRATIVASLDGVANGYANYSPVSGLAIVEYVPVELSAETLEAIERLLITALTDIEAVEGPRASDGDFSDPRVCDFAGRSLATRFPDEYQFDWGAPLAARDEQRCVAINKWRKEHGQAPLDSGRK